MLSSNELNELSPQSSSTGRPVLTVLLVMLSVLGSLPLFGFQAASWAQPSVVGMIWGGLFLAGFGLATVGRESKLHVLAVPCCAIVLMLAFRSITDLTLQECLVVAAALVGTGWLARRLDRRMLKASNEPMNLPRSWQVPMIDFFIATTLIACLARAMIDMTNPPIMLISILGTLVVGCGCCWAAYHWTWNDTQPVGLPLVVVALLALAGVGVLVRVSPLAPVELAAWLLVGPLSVLASQSFTVLLVFAAIRWQSRSMLASQG